MQEIIPELDLRGRSHYEKNSYRDKQMDMLTDAVALLIRCQLNALIKLIGNFEHASCCGCGHMMTCITRLN